MEKAVGTVLVFSAVQTKNRHPVYSTALTGTGVVGRLGRGFMLLI